LKAWFAIPSARPAREANETLRKWYEKGYGIALWRDSADDETALLCHVVLTGSYPGYARAVNALAADILARDPHCDWIVTGGDDTEPDPDHSPAEIARECIEHFGGAFGVMQPTGDRWADGSIDRICGSPWMGREFCQRMYQGNGPLWPEFTHMFVDSHLQCVAQKLGILWQRRDLTHRHNHFCRVGEGVDWNHGNATMPEFLRKVNSPEHWAHSQAIFDRLRAWGFAEANDLLPATL
jgi:hypothetical protein